jgi:NAD(P)-dependent dehydrogenase (short-subunit alcohol dehydrogenase family)
MKDFMNRVVAITGAGSGIGRALALAFGSRGARLALSDVSMERLRDTSQSLVEAGVGPERVWLTELDVARRDEVFAWAQQTVEHFGVVNLLVNNAGVSLTCTTETMSQQDFDWLMNINLGGVLSGCQAFLPALRAADEGHIVNLSSVFGLAGVPGQAAYAMSKSAVRALSDCLAAELMGSSVGVTCVHPGGIKTRIARDGRFPDRDPRPIIDSFENRMAKNSADYCAKKILRAIERRKRRVLVGADARLLDWLVRLFPGTYQRLISVASR